MKTHRNPKDFCVKIGNILFSDLLKFQSDLLVILKYTVDHIVEILGKVTGVAQMLGGIVLVGQHISLTQDPLHLINHFLGGVQQIDLGVNTSEVL